MARNPGKKKRAKGHIRNKAFWLLVYTTLGLLALIGATLIARGYVIVADPYTPPDFNATKLSVPAPAPIPAPYAVAELTPAPAPPVKRIPIRIYFAGQEVQADIQQVGITEDGSSIDTVPSATVAGWFTQGASPGDPGASIINGHDRWEGKKGVFSVLKEMEPGEEVIVEFADGLLRYFEVDRIETYLTEDVPAEYRTVGRTTETQLILFTCKGDYGSDGYSKSRVVAICHEKIEKRRADDAFVDYRVQSAGAKSTVE